MRHCMLVSVLTPLFLQHQSKMGACVEENSCYIDDKGSTTCASHQSTADVGKTAERVAKAAGIDDFAAAVQNQLIAGRYRVRVFDFGGTGVKTGVISATSLRKFMETPETLLQIHEPKWKEAPLPLGMVPQDEAISPWMHRKIPQLQAELTDPNVIFGISTAGRLDHSTGILHSGWAESQGSQKNQTVASMLGLLL
eukprot:gnl/MRDRNA2_/MRDRNA2_80597_c0_seq1.p1 gnl/MRDRNA2_/MRDRNA2_80597_c0~~gnl/MRDRNA2_/MRDRNA2_80597_c0_seq1.p1  ORF type:complete len:196 (+),score=40.76 gnl/MRDRNA2_/MRDRNA2_80597_c0_seq1:103-690(+)